MAASLKRSASVLRAIQDRAEDPSAKRLCTVQRAVSKEVVLLSKGFGLPVALEALITTFLNINEITRVARASKPLNAMVEAQTPLSFIRALFKKAEGEGFDRAGFLRDWKAAINASQGLRIDRTFASPQNFPQFGEAFKMLNIPSNVHVLCNHQRKWIRYSDQDLEKLPLIAKRWNAFLTSCKFFSRSEQKLMQSYAPHMLGFEQAFGCEPFVVNWGKLLNVFIDLLQRGRIAPEKQKNALLALASGAKDALPKVILHNLIQHFNALVDDSTERLTFRLFKG